MGVDKLRTSHESVVTMNTKIANDWAMQNLKGWMEVHANTSEPIPEDQVYYETTTHTWSHIKHERNIPIKNDQCLTCLF